MDHPGGVAGGGVRKVTERLKFHSHCSRLQICRRHVRLGGKCWSAVNMWWEDRLIDGNCYIILHTIALFTRVLVHSLALARHLR